MSIPMTFAELQTQGRVMTFLPRHRARAEYSLGKLDEVGFTNIVLVEGVDGFTTDVHQIAAGEGWSFHRDATATRIGCALSTLRLWRRVVDDGLPYLLIFEDDVLPRPDVTDLGHRYWEKTPRDVDFVYLGNQMTVEPDDRDRLVVQALSWCTHAYIITIEGARRGLQLLSQPQHDLLVGSIDGIDTQIRDWMSQEVIRWACWNGTRLPKVFSTSDEMASVPAASDVAWSARDTGLFYQNYMLGSTIHDPEIVWNTLGAGAHKQS
jgi:hypothetical protein